MSATQQMAAMLNELMGSGRNATIGESSILRFDDRSVCKNFLAGFCPNELFTNTKADMGACNLVHDEELKRAYQESDQFEKLGYEQRFLKALGFMTEEIKRKISRHEDRLRKTQPGMFSQDSDDTATEKYKEQVKTLEKDITDLFNLSSEAAEKGEISRAKDFTERADRLRTELKKLERNIFGGDGMSGKPLEVCQVCGCFMIIGDAQQRLDEHFCGRQHMGYAKLFEALEELKVRIPELEAKKRRYEEETGGGRQRRYRSDRDDRDHRRSRSRSPARRSNRGDRDRDSDRHRGGRDYGRSRGYRGNETGSRRNGRSRY